MPELILLRIRGERAIDVRRYAGDAEPTPEPCSHRRVAREFARLVVAHPDAVIAWCDVRIAPFLADVRTWPARLRNPLEVLHLSCFQRCDRMIGSLGLVDFSSCFLLPGPTDRRYVTWLLSPMAGIGHAALFRAGAFDGRLSSWTLALFDFGYRALAHGLLPYSDPGLLRAPIWPSTQEELERSLTPSQNAVLVRRMLGRKWVLFWFAASLLFHRRCRGISALRGLLATAPPKTDIAAFRRLHAAVTAQALTPAPSTGRENSQGGWRPAIPLEPPAG